MRSFFLLCLLVSGMSLWASPPDSTAIYHKVKTGEDVVAIAKKYHVRASQLRTWNHLPNNLVKAGDSLIIGYKKAPVVIAQQRLVSDDTMKRKDSVVKKEVTVRDTVEEMRQYRETEKLEGGIGARSFDGDLAPGKFLAYHAKLPAGTIVKVTNQSNKKTVYVKIVGKIPATYEGNNIIVISKAAADKISAEDEQFACKISYGKK